MYIDINPVLFQFSAISRVNAREAARAGLRRRVPEDRTEDTRCQKGSGKKNVSYTIFVFISLSWPHV